MARRKHEIQFVKEWTNSPSAKTERLGFRLTEEEELVVGQIAARYAVSKSDVLDCVLEVFMRELEKAGSLGELMKPKSWGYSLRVVQDVDELLMGLEARPKRRRTRVM